ncbi:Bromodomain protein [Oesophagostomum dentatum]|uniref:Bromodomain protein n=1 Tax=Oesophagostomum dentatum TaxID=61180 RepID=A0A0B1SLX0_OESDE|nr:Bromodomain protein [Oesophagostomum dentatum]
MCPKIGEDLAASASKISGITANQKLKIYRTMKNPDGTESTRVEVVTRPQLIEAYTRIRMTKDENFIEVYAQMDEQFKERAVEKKPVPIKPNLIKMRCSACHGTGHMKTNKNCPLYGKDPSKTPLKDAGSGTSDGDDESTSLTGELVAVEGTKVKINRKVINSHDHSGKKRKFKRNLFIQEAPSHVIWLTKQENEVMTRLAPRMLVDVKRMLDNSRLYNGDNHVITDAAKKMFELASKRLVEKEQQLMKLEKAINPLLDDNDRVGFGFVLEKIVQACKNIPKSVPFHTRVDAKKVPFYYQKITKPMDLGTIEANVKAHHYVTVEEFRNDIHQILINSEMYNGPAEKSSYTAKATEIVALADKMLAENSVQLSELEANINGFDLNIGEVEPEIEEAMANDEEMTDAEEGGVLVDDLALSGNELEDEEMGEGCCN